MRKLFLIIHVLYFSTGLRAQDTTQSITISGEGVKTITMNEGDLAAFPTVSLDSLVIYNHVMEYRKTMYKIKGVPLKDILDRATINVKTPKDLSMYYFVFTARDGYKVVMSWNEIFNSTNRLQPMIMTSKDGKALKDLDDKLALITPGDRATGRRYVKGLKSITVLKAN